VSVRKRIGEPLGAVCLGLAAVVLLEGILRLLGVEATPPSDPFAGFSSAVPVFEPAWRSDGAPVYRISTARAPRMTAELAREGHHEFLAVPPANGLRIFVIGESSVAGTPYPSRHAFPAWMQARLEAALPGTPIEVVNAGFPGYSSRRLLLVARAIAESDPDVVVVYLGHNEWAEARYYRHLIDLDPRLFRLWERVARTSLYASLARFLARPPPPPSALREVDFDADRNAMEMFAALRHRVDRTDVPTAREWEYRDLLYERNLEEMGRLFVAAGALPVFLTLAQNLADWPPGTSIHPADWSGDDDARFEALVRSGDALAAASRFAAALETYREALALDGEYADTHYRIAQCLRALGRFEEALRHYRLASDLDRVPHGAPTRFNEVVRRVARRVGGVLVDVDGALVAAAAHGLPGDDLFVDFVHPNLRAHQLIARTVVEALRDAGLPSAGAAWDGAGYRDPDPADLLRETPELRERELEIQIFTCQLAAREACVAERAEALRAVAPANVVALRALGRAAPAR
jgi:tetratricopeptide (TPR) repeat protein